MCQKTRIEELSGMKQVVEVITFMCNNDDLTDLVFADTELNKLKTVFDMSRKEMRNRIKTQMDD